MAIGIPGVPDFGHCSKNIEDVENNDNNNIPGIDVLNKHMGGTMPYKVETRFGLTLSCLSDSHSDHLPSIRIRMSCHYLSI